MSDSDSAKVAAYCEEHLDLGPLESDSTGFYQSLPLCVVDSVFSIGVRYESVKNAIRSCCDYLQIKPFREEKDQYPPQSDQLSIQSFLKTLAKFSDEQAADIVFKNRHRTSSRGGILKSEAVQRFASILLNNGVNYFEDIEDVLREESETRLKSIKSEICEIPGQSSGISTTYFLMLAATDKLVKPDRMILRFLARALSRPENSFSSSEAQTIISEAVEKLSPKFPNLTARLLDNRIWVFQRQQKESLK